MIKVIKVNQVATALWAFLTKLFVDGDGGGQKSVYQILQGDSLFDFKELAPRTETHGHYSTGKMHSNAFHPSDSDDLKESLKT